MSLNLVLVITTKSLVIAHCLRQPLITLRSSEHRALVERVHQDFAFVRKEITPFIIEFPTNMTVIKGGGAVLFGEEGPVVVPIHNISALQYAYKNIQLSHRIGRGAPQPSVLGVSFHISSETTGGSNAKSLVPGDLRIRTWDGQVIDDFATGTFPFRLLSSAICLRCGQA